MSGIGRAHNVDVGNRLGYSTDTCLFGYGKYKGKRVFFSLKFYRAENLKAGGALAGMEERDMKILGIGDFHLVVFIFVL